VLYLPIPLLCSAVILDPRHLTPDLGSMHVLYVPWSVGLCNYIYVAICLSLILAAASRCRRFRNARYLRASMYLYGQLTRLKSLSCWKQLFGKLDTAVVRWMDSDYLSGYGPIAVVRCARCKCANVAGEGETEGRKAGTGKSTRVLSDGA
jgi:hypothetical protein